MFFEKENNARVLSSFLHQSSNELIDDKVRATRLSISRDIIRYISKSPTTWDETCTFNIKNIGEQFLDSLNVFDQSKPSHIDNIYSMSYRFLCEYDFLVGAGKELNMELRSIKDKIQGDIGEMDDMTKSQIIYASYMMPVNIAKYFINNANISDFKGFEQKKLEAEGLKQKWDEEIDKKEAKVEALKDKLEQYKTAFNFVALDQGFSNLGNKKAKEVFWLFLSLLGMGGLILSPLIAEIVIAVTRIYSGETLGLDHLIVLVPIFSIEIILIYFFRVILLNHRSVKAQIMQIELRQTLCQFIQSYADYSSEIKKQDEKALEKFENLIFSAIMSDTGNLPNTFDGVEQIAKLIKSVKNS
ncbi:hypothetical protein [Moritella sp. 28]|uniref:hypothetical protein n=1 Tax=Moritella sp. 28 TaxID=2746232 RepID=UPI001BA9DEC2|nr:hypothetical protein [Moritella sp. 28]QUM84425.1 hypothetical protein HWV02_07860 [Moritella sp. 28]